MTHSATEIVFLVLLIVFNVVGMVFAYHLHLITCYCRKHHPQIIDEIKGLAIGTRLKYLANSIVFPHRKLRSELAGAGIRDPKLEALISSTVFWNRVTMVVFAFIVLSLVILRWQGWTS